MAYFKINTQNVHFSFIAQLHNGTQIHFGFSPRGGSAGQEKYHEILKVLTQSIGHAGTLGFLGMLTTLNMFVLYKIPLVGSITSVLFLNEVNKFITSRDGIGVVHHESKVLDYENDESSFPLSLEQEEILLSFINHRTNNCPKYEVYQYNCASFVKEAFCEVYPSECDSFKGMVFNQIYENLTISNLVAAAFLNSIGALD